MTYHRFGKIKLKNHLNNCFYDLFFLIIGITGIVTGYSEICGAVFLGIVVFDVTSVVIPYMEKFTFNQKRIIACKGRAVYEKIFPEKIIVVISYADMCTDLAKRVSLINQTYVLKESWAISILDNVGVEKVLERLHRKGAFRYTNCWIEEWLAQYFVYSFVCNQSILEEVLLDKDFTLIIPETLASIISTKNLRGEIYIDKGF